MNRGTGAAAGGASGSSGGDDTTGSQSNGAAPGSGEAVPGGGQDKPPAPEQDDDGIQDGLYVGNVSFLGWPEGSVEGFPPWEILESSVKLDVKADSVAVVVEYVYRGAARWTPQSGTLCTSTIRMGYSGTGKVSNYLSLMLAPVVQEIVSLEGDCGVQPDFGVDYTVEESLLQRFAKKEPIAFSGSFSGPSFAGKLGTVVGVSAGI